MEAIIDNGQIKGQNGINVVAEESKKAFVDTFTYEPYIPEYKEALFNGREDDYFPDENDK